MTINRQLYDNYGPTRPVYVHRTYYPENKGFNIHDHDFPEIFLIEEGYGFHLINGEERLIRTGECLFVHPHIQHGLRAAADSSMVILNVSFPQALLLPLQPFIPETLWPWQPSHTPLWKLNEEQQRFFSQRVDLLAEAESSELDLGAFLLELIRLINPAHRREAVDAPEWLAEALDIINHPKHLALGTQELARICGRNSATISRAIKKHYQCTSIQLLNRYRIDWIARKLRLTRRSISDLAAEVGLPNLSHMYALFHTTHGCSPHAYRQRV